MSRAERPTDEPLPLPAAAAFVLSRDPLCLRLPRSPVSKALGILSAVVLGAGVIATLAYVAATGAFSDGLEALAALGIVSGLVGVPVLLHLALGATRLELRLLPDRLVFERDSRLGGSCTLEVLRDRVWGVEVEVGGNGTVFSDWKLEVRTEPPGRPLRIGANDRIEKSVLDEVAVLIRCWAQGAVVPRVDREPPASPEVADGPGRQSVSADSPRCPGCGSAVPAPEVEAPAWRARCAACDARFDVVRGRLPDGPFREQVLFESVAGPPPPLACFRDGSGNGWIRRVIVEPANRRSVRQRAYPGLLGAASVLGGLAALVESSGGNVFGAVFLAVFGFLFLAHALSDRRQEIGLREGALEWTSYLGPWRRTRRLLVTSPDEVILAVAKTPKALLRIAGLPHLAITSAGSTGAPWQVAVGRNPAGLEWLAAHLRDGLELLSRRSGIER